MSRSSALSRRSFFKLVGGGIVVFIGLRSPRVRAQVARRLYPEDFNAYLVIGETGRVTAFSGKIEMGQDVLTSQAQMVAEELAVELASIDMVLGDTDRCPWDMGTFGSLTTRMFGPALRAAAAQARLTLMSIAATRFGVPVERLTAKSGAISVVGEPARSVSYGELSRGARIALVIDEKAVLRAASEFSVMGSSPPRLDGIEKVTGAAKYAADIRLPGMLYARLLRPPAHGAKLLDVDTRDAESMAGVRLVRDGDLLAVLHADPEVAATALTRLRARWQAPESGPDSETIFAHLVRASTDRKTALDRGDLSAARAGAAFQQRSTYQKGYVAHAPLEPHAALAEFKQGKLTIWASTQTPFPMRDEVAQRLGLAAPNVRVITPYVGGGFGGKSAGGQAVEAARLARLTGKPVQVAWTREEEFFYDTFDPAAVVSIESGFGPDGRLSFWDYAVYAAGARGTALFYDIANARIEIIGGLSYGSETDKAGLHPFAVGPWRAPGANMNVFAVESQIDAMAAAAKVDPVEFRLRHLSDARMRRVLLSAAKAFGWQPAAGPSGRGMGVACSIDAGTYVATCAQVEVDRATGKIRVSRLVCAQDMGIVVNPVGAKMQIEGCLNMGLGYTLSEELNFRGGEVLDRNFDSYRLPRFSDVARIETVLVKNDDLAPQGGGEPAITCTGAVLANAVFDAIGVRLRRLPMTAERVRQAMLADSTVKGA